MYVCVCVCHVRITNALDIYGDRTKMQTSGHLHALTLHLRGNNPGTHRTGDLKNQDNGKQFPLWRYNHSAVRPTAWSLYWQLLQGFRRHEIQYFAVEIDGTGVCLHSGT